MGLREKLKTTFTRKKKNNEISKSVSEESWQNNDVAIDTQNSKINISEEILDKSKATKEVKFKTKTLTKQKIEDNLDDWVSSTRLSLNQ